MKLTFVTGNSNKLREAGAYLEGTGIRLEQVSLEIDEIQHHDAEKVTVHKAVEAYAMLRKPVLVEDVGLEITGLHGYPGSLVKHFLAAMGSRGITACLHGKARKAKGVCVFAFFDGKGAVCFRGETEGRISEEPRGDRGFGWDSIFVPDGESRTFAEMSPADKQRFSPRAKALLRLRAWAEKQDGSPR